MACIRLKAVRGWNGKGKMPTNHTLAHFWFGQALARARKARKATKIAPSAAAAAAETGGTIGAVGNSEAKTLGLSLFGGTPFCQGKVNRRPTIVGVAHLKTNPPLATKAPLQAKHRSQMQLYARRDDRRDDRRGDKRERRDSRGR